MNASFSRTSTVFREGHFLYRKSQIFCCVKRKEGSFFAFGLYKCFCKSGISVFMFCSNTIVSSSRILTMKDIILALDFLSLNGSPCFSNLNTICKSLLVIPTTTTTKQKKPLYQPTSLVENCLKVMSG